jgi:hypothetical protein
MVEKIGHTSGRIEERPYRRNSLPLLNYLTRATVQRSGMRLIGSKVSAFVSLRPLSFK